MIFQGTGFLKNDDRHQSLNFFPFHFQDQKTNHHLFMNKKLPKSIL